MSLKIEQIILHQLIREAEQRFDLILRETPLKNDANSEAMMTELCRVYNHKSKTYGLFQTESQFANALQKYRNRESTFTAFTAYCSELLRDECVKYSFVRGGVILFCEYRYLTSNYLLVAILESCDSMRVSETLDVRVTHYLDIERADMIARIDLTEWEREPTSLRTLTFLKGRIGRRVADFFLDFLAANIGVDTKAQNQNLLKAVEDYCSDEQLSKEERKAYRQQVYSYCQGQLKSGEEIAVPELSSHLSEWGNQNFAQFIHEKEYGLEEQFPVDRNTIKRLTKFSGSGGGVTLSFESTLLGEKIEWDPISDTLVLKGVPPNLRSQLEQYREDSE